MSIESKTWPWALTLALLGAVFLLCDAKPDYTGLYGPYCATRYQELRCCNGRQDDCSVPILGTFCYCDDFCSNRTAEEDCCPDYWSYCRGDDDGPASIFSGECTYNGKNYYHGNTFKENCNTCKCSSLDGESEVLCETNRCLMDQEVINRVNILENPGWVARNYSFFWGHTLNEGLKRRLGTLNPSHSLYRMYPVRKIYNPSDLPREFDSRLRWSREISPIRDQGWCGASWALSTVDVASDRFGIMSKGAETVRLSPQHLMSCNSRGQLGCNGGYLDRAWFYVRKFGLVDEECYPWTGQTEKCRVARKGKLLDEDCKHRNSCSLANEYYKVGPPYRLANETDIMHEIQMSGPVQATMRVHQDFFNYESGIYTHTSSMQDCPSGYHSVRIIGWGEEPSPITGKPVKFWRVANSWGREWGEDGYFRILRGTNECEIESYVIGIWAKTI